MVVVLATLHFYVRDVGSVVVPLLLKFFNQIKGIVYRIYDAVAISVVGFIVGSSVGTISGKQHGSTQTDGIVAVPSAQISTQKSGRGLPSVGQGS